eukprot:6491257-Amphidinium_carterae.1
MFILSNMDDLLIIGEESAVSDFITNISKVFNLKHTTHPQAHYSSVRKIHRRSKSAIEISMMDNFLKSVYEIYGLQKSNSVSAQGVKSPALPTSGDEPLHFSNHRKYRTAGGKLQWMAAVRPDIQSIFNSPRIVVLVMAP